MYIFYSYHQNLKTASSNNLNNSKANGIPKIPQSIVFIGKLLQLFSKQLAAIYAIWLFRTPIRHPLPDREKMMDKSASSQFIDIPSLNKTIKVYTYGYSKKKVLLVHGWSGRGTQLYAMADKLLENGFMTVSFDGPAHGLSTGKTTAMPEFMEACYELDNKFGPFELAIGHSMGGMAIVNSVPFGLRVNKIISIGAGNKITDIINDFVRLIGLNQAIGKIIEQKFNKQFKAKIADYATSNVAKQVKIPAFIIHDSQDKEIPVSCAYSIRQNLKSGQLLITNGLGHKRILKDASVIKRIVEFSIT